MEVDDPGDSENISAYAKLDFDEFSFFIQTLTLVIGRKAKREDNVDVHLGISKSISRVHAKIYYQFDAICWEIEVLGKNGAFVNERYIEAGGRCPLRNTDKLQIGETNFVFLLPDGAAAPTNPAMRIVPVDRPVSASVVNRPSIQVKSVAMKSVPPPPVTTALATPMAPHHLMQNLLAPCGLATGTGANLVTTKVTPPRSTVQPKENIHLTQTTTTNDVYTVSTGSQMIENFADAENPDLLDTPSKKARKKYTKKDTSVKLEDVPTSPVDSKLWMLNVEGTLSMPPITPLIVPEVPTESAESIARTEEERKAQEEEAAAQHAAQLLHQERLARQAREEEEGLILPPPETDPAIIAALQKPSASYATMIYNAIASHEKKKMTLAQIYSWICIYHPYYRYVQNGWQNSIRHNLSLNKAFMKVPRTDDEPGKGSFWAVDPESEMLFEGGVYKKKPPRPVPTVLASRGAPVVMKDGKLALNPNFFVGGLQGKAEEVLQMLQTAVQRQLGYGNSEVEASQLARILALALATQLRQAAVASNNARQQHSPAAIQRPAASSIKPLVQRYPPMALVGGQRPAALANQIYRTVVTIPQTSASSPHTTTGQASSSQYVATSAPGARVPQRNTSVVGQPGSLPTAAIATSTIAPDNPSHPVPPTPLKSAEVTTTNSTTIRSSNPVVCNPYSIANGTAGIGQTTLATSARNPQGQAMTATGIVSKSGIAATGASTNNIPTTSTSMTRLSATSTITSTLPNGVSRPTSIVSAATSQSSQGYKQTPVNADLQKAIASMNGATTPSRAAPSVTTPRSTSTVAAAGQTFAHAKPQVTSGAVRAPIFTASVPPKFNIASTSSTAIARPYAPASAAAAHPSLATVPSSSGTIPVTASLPKVLPVPPAIKPAIVPASLEHKTGVLGKVTKVPNDTNQTPPAVPGTTEVRTESSPTTTLLHDDQTMTPAPAGAAGVKRAREDAESTEQGAKRLQKASPEGVF